MSARSSGQGLTGYLRNWPDSPTVICRLYICALTIQKHYGRYIFLALLHDEQPNQKGLLLG